MLSNEPRTVDEGYASACASSDLRVQADIRGDADYVIAAGMNKSRFGALLLRLVTEWDRAEKPKRPTPKAIDALSRTYKVAGTVRERQEKAREEAFGWYSHELNILAGKLKTLMEAREQLWIQAGKFGMQEPKMVAEAAIGWWLMQQCPACSGVMWQSIPGTGRLSNKACRACQGSGVTQPPHGAEGRKLANYMDECVAQARIDIRKRLKMYVAK